MHGVGDGPDEKIDGSLVVGAILLVMVGFTARNFVHDERIADDNTLHHPLGHNLFSFPVEELVFDGRAAAVKCHYNHVYPH
jgi:hypothetical protein